jgi:hypothetical protein
MQNYYYCYYYYYYYKHLGTTFLVSGFKDEIR